MTDVENIDNPRFEPFGKNTNHYPKNIKNSKRLAIRAICAGHPF